MKERGILFSGAMVRAILAGRKTQTRRLVDPRNRDTYTQIKGRGSIFDPRLEEHRSQMLECCPYGTAGDRLWVRETWCPGHGLATVASPDILMAPAGAALAPGILYAADGTKLPLGCHWRPSIFLPRHFSRITLDVVDVRIERLQEITDADAKAEGVPLVPQGLCPCRRTDIEDPGPHIDTCAWRDVDVDPTSLPEHVREFAILWNGINGKRARWSSNPWVWVVSFKRVDERKAES